MSAIDWIKPGSPVVVYRVGRSRDDTASTALSTTIVRVTRLSFTVTNGERFNIDTLASKRHGNSGVGWRNLCIYADSDKARELLARKYRLSLEYKAREACSQWMHHRSEATRIAAVEELTKLGEFASQSVEDA